MQARFQRLKYVRHSAYVVRKAEKLRLRRFAQFKDEERRKYKKPEDVRHRTNKRGPREVVVPTQFAFIENPALKMGSATISFF